MGAEPWQCLAPYQPDIAAALHELRRSVFAAGTFRGSDLAPASIEEALENMDADGTASILDIDHVAQRAGPTGVTVLTAAQLARYFGTERPTRADVERADAFWEDIGRGEAVCIVLYENDDPAQLFFAGYSFD